MKASELRAKDVARSRRRSDLLKAHFGLRMQKDADADQQLRSWAGRAATSRAPKTILAERRSRAAK